MQKDLKLEIPGESAQAQELRDLVDVAATSELDVALRGEQGAGLEDFARIIHRRSKRSSGSFVAISLAALPEGLAAAELFGFERGAFTGATLDRLGLIAVAQGGTVFLDDVGGAPGDVQAMLLRVLQRREVLPVGSTRPRKVDVRFIAAITTDSSGELVGDVRLDLLYRLSALQITVPSLRARPEDIRPIAEELLKRLEPQDRHLVLANDAVHALRQHDFPGNIRELESVLAHAKITSKGPAIRRADLAIRLHRRKRLDRASPDAGTLGRELEAARRELDALRARSIAADPIWQGRQFPVEKDYCFVLMPFADVRNVQAIFRQHVRPAIERCGLRCERADDIYDISGVMQSVWEGINRARLIVADLTERNANVFYELGIAHTLGKPVIMLTQDIDHVPFDLRHLRCIVYAYTPPGVKMLEDALERTTLRALSVADSLRIFRR
jgi:hypothetical protein